MPAEQLIVRIPSDLKRWIEAKAAEEGRTHKTVVIRILEAQRRREDTTRKVQAHAHTTT